MEPIYVGDLIPSISSYQKVIDKYEKALKKGNFMRSQLEKIQFIQIGKNANYKNYLCFSRLDKRMAKM